MDSQPWRVVLVRAWVHDGDVAAVLLVGSEPGWPASARRVTTGSVEAACTALGTILGELTTNPAKPTDPPPPE
jgi:hypothetical protein